MSSKVSICNFALSKFGSLEISSLIEDTKERIACTNVFDDIRDIVLCQHPWNFAVKRAVLAQLTETPAFEYTYKYQIPSDCLMAWAFYGSSAKWVREGEEILTDDEEVNLLYIAKITDVSLFPPPFVNCLTFALAAEIAPRITQDPKIRQRLISEFYVALEKAKFLNAIEGNRPVPEAEKPLDAASFSWQKEGR